MVNPAALPASDGDAPVVEVIYAAARVQHVISVEYSAGLTAVEAVQLSGLLLEFPEINSSRLVLGLFGESAALEQSLAPGDRVEICRPLQQDPRDMRSGLAASGKSMGRSRKSTEN